MPAELIAEIARGIVCLEETSRLGLNLLWQYVFQISSTDPLTASPVGVPMRVQKIATSKSAFRRICLLSTPCARSSIEGCECVSQPTGISAIPLDWEWIAFHS